MKPCSAWTITNFASGFGLTCSSISRNGTPSQSLSNMLQRVTQWMSRLTDLRRQRHELVVVERDRVLDQAPDPEVPCRRVELRDRAVVQHRPLLGQVLAGRQAVAKRLVALGPPAIEEVERHGCARLAGFDWFELALATAELPI